MGIFIGIDISPQSAVTLCVLNRSGYPALCLSGSCGEDLWCAPLARWCEHFRVACAGAVNPDDIAQLTAQIVRKMCSSQSQVTLALSVPFFWQALRENEFVSGRNALPLRTTDREIARLCGHRVVPFLEDTEKLGPAAHLGHLIVGCLTAGTDAAKFSVNLFGRKSNPPVGRKIIEVYPPATLFALSDAGESMRCIAGTADGLGVLFNGTDCVLADSSADAVISAFTAFLSGNHQRPHLLFKPIECEEVSDLEFADIAREGWISMPKPLPRSGLRTTLSEHLKLLLRRLESGQVHCGAGA